MSNFTENSKQKINKEINELFKNSTSIFEKEKAVNVLFKIKTTAQGQIASRVSLKEVEIAIAAVNKEKESDYKLLRAYLDELLKKKQNFFNVYEEDAEKKEKNTDFNFWDWFAGTLLGIFLVNLFEFFKSPVVVKNPGVVVINVDRHPQNQDENVVENKKQNLFAGSEFGESFQLLNNVIFEENFKKTDDSLNNTIEESLKIENNYSLNETIKETKEEERFPEFDNLLHAAKDDSFLNAAIKEEKKLEGFDNSLNLTVEEKLNNSSDSLDNTNVSAQFQKAGVIETPVERKFFFNTLLYITPEGKYLNNPLFFSPIKPKVELHSDSLWSYSANDISQAGDSLEISIREKKESFDKTIKEEKKLIGFDDSLNFTEDDSFLNKTIKEEEKLIGFDNSLNFTEDDSFLNKTIKEKEKLIGFDNSLNFTEDDSFLNKTIKEEKDLGKFDDSLNNTIEESIKIENGSSSLNETIKEEERFSLIENSRCKTILGDITNNFNSPNKNNSSFYKEDENKKPIIRSLLPNFNQHN